MRKVSRRALLGVASKTAAAGCSLAALPASIRAALTIEPNAITGTLQDVQHVVMLMQENRSFDHYFGTMSGVRGYGDRSQVPQRRTHTVFSQHDGQRVISPFHLDTHTTQAMRVEGTPHSWPDAQLAWDDGRISEWPRWKFFQSMGYYEGDDIPFQRALADAFTLCDAHHCSIQSGTFVNRLVYMSGTNFTPGTGVATSQTEAAIDGTNNRGNEFGAYAWTTYPERLEAAGVSWRIYQEDDWGGLCAPWQAFDVYKKARPGEPLFENALRRWTLRDFSNHVRNGSLPQVSWIVPPPVWSEHPAASSPLQGAAFIQSLLTILSSNPDVWGRTVFLISFDENDGFFDHVPPPAPPSFDEAGKLCGGSTLDDSAMAGLYFRNEIAGKVVARPYGLGPRVPLYAVSPWSRGGWVCSQVFDHTSTIRFLEARFGVEEPNISAWHRSVSGDLTSCFDFSRPTFTSLPQFPDVSGAPDAELVLDQLAPVSLPTVNQLPRQEPGIRRSRALPYRVSLDAATDPEAQAIEMIICNDGAVGVVVHVYDRLHLDLTPHRYTVEAGKQMPIRWNTARDEGAYDLEAFGPNGFRWIISGTVPSGLEQVANPEVVLRHKPVEQAIELTAKNSGRRECMIVTSPNIYRSDPETSLWLAPGTEAMSTSWPVSSSGFWYDFTVEVPTLPGWLRRFAGRVETGRHGISDPALGGRLRPC